MATTRDDIRKWLEHGKTKGATHMVVVCDTYDYDDYPVYVERGQNAKDVVQAYSEQQMTRVMEVYSYALDLEQQLAEHRSWNFDVKKVRPRPKWFDARGNVHLGGADRPGDMLCGYSGLVTQLFDEELERTPTSCIICIGLEPP